MARPFDGTGEDAARPNSPWSQLAGDGGPTGKAVVQASAGYHSAGNCWQKRSPGTGEIVTDCTPFDEALSEESHCSYNDTDVYGQATPSQEVCPREQ